VTSLREGEPIERPPLSVWRHVGRETGADAMSLRVLELRPGTSPGLRSDAEDVLFVIEGTGTAFLDGWPHGLRPDAGLFVRAGARLSFVNPGPGPLTMLSAQCPDPGPAFEVEGARMGSPAGEAPPAPGPVVHLSDRATEQTGDRWYRVMVDEAVGSRNVTQFVGSIPPGRAPDHFHRYDEVVYVLSGEGAFHVDGDSAPLSAGSCIHLPAGLIHCLENHGPGEMQVLGVFRPAGSPAEAYYPDGSAAVVPAG